MEERVVKEGLWLTAGAALLGPTPLSASRLPIRLTDTS